MNAHSEQLRDSYASLLSHANSPEATKLIADISRDAGAWEIRTGARKNRRGHASIRKFSDAMERFVGDLLSAKANAERSGVIYHRLRSDAFTGGPVSLRDFVAASEALIGMALVTKAGGKGRFQSFDGASLGQLKGKATRYTAAPSLVALAKSAGVTLDRIDDHFREETPLRPLVLKRKKVRSYYEQRRAGPIRIISTEHTKRLEATVRSLNSFLSGFTLGGAIFRGFERVFNECADQGTYRWNKGGRLYSVWPISGSRPYQQLPDTERARITIDGEPTHEIDVRACNLTIFHAKLGADFDPSVDPYERTGLNRDIAKAWTVASFGAGRPITKWSPEAVTEYRENTGRSLSKECTAREAGEKVIAAYPALLDLEGSGVSWADLMFLESEAIVGAMTALMMRHGAPSFPVHDSLVVRQRDISVACDLLQESFYVHVDAYPWLAIKDATDTVNDLVRQSLERYRRPSALDL